MGSEYLYMHPRVEMISGGGALRHRRANASKSRRAFLRPRASCLWLWESTTSLSLTLQREQAC